MDVWIGPVAVTALDRCLVLPPGDRAWVDVLVGPNPGQAIEAQIREALTQYHLHIDTFGAIERVRDRNVPLERTAQRLEKELTKRAGVRLTTFRAISA